MSSLKMKNKGGPLRRHSQEKVLHEGQHDRSKCHTWTGEYGLQEAREVSPPGSSALAEPWGILGPVVSTRLQGGLTGRCLGVSTTDSLSQDFVHCPGREEANADVTDKLQSSFLQHRVSISLQDRAVSFP